MEVEWKALHEKAVRIAGQYLRAESDLIEILSRIDESRGYRQLGYKSLYEYATEALRLSESITYNLITVSRKVPEIPRLQEMIRSRLITLSNARRIAPILTPENQDEWLQAASSLSKRELERKIAAQSPEHLIEERVHFVSADRLELRVGLSEKLHEKLERVRDLLSSQRKAAVSFEDAFEEIVEAYLERKDPVRKVNRARPLTGTSPSTKFRRIPIELKNAVIRRDQGQCTHVRKDGSRCPERKWLDIHHIRPFSEGGATELENLTTLCRGHHQVLHAVNLSRDRFG